VVKVGKQHRCMCWKLTDETGELLDRRNSESANVEQSMQELKESFEGITGDYVNVLVTPKKPQRGGDQITSNFNFKIKCITGAPAGITESRELPALQVQKGDAGIYSILTELKVQLAEQKKDVEINELKRQLADKAAGNSKNKLLEKLLTTMLLPEIKELQQPVAGVDPVQQPVASPVHSAEQVSEAKAQQQKLVQVLNKMKNLDADFINTLEKLQQFAESNPAAYQQYKNAL